MGRLYTKMKIFHFKEKLYSLPETEETILPPIHIRIKPTNVCGHNCWYCAYTCDNLQLGKDMVRGISIPRDKMMEIVDDIVEMGVLAVTFSGGGDPFYYPHFLETVKKLSQTPITFAALTNGARLQGELAEIFAYYGTWLRISIDGWDDESYSWYRRIPEGEYSKLIRNMEQFKALDGKCYLGVSIVVDQKNADHIYELIGKMREIGVNSVKVSPCIISNNGVENDTYHQSIFERVKEQIQRAIEDFEDSRFEIFDAYHTLSGEFTKTYTWCPFLQILPVIGADMNIYPCQDKAYNLKEGLIGSIKEQSFKEFWFSEKKQFFKINPSISCQHRCVADAKNRLILEYLNADREHLGFV